MKPDQLIDKLKEVFSLSTDTDLGRFVGLTGGRLSQWRSSSKDLTTRQIASLIKRTSELSKKSAVKSAIRPIVELYPVQKTESQQKAKWEIIPTGEGTCPREYSLRKHLEKAKGIYFFYDSGCKILYTGKTEKQTLWKEINSAFNRERQSHQVYQVRHPKIGKSFTPAWKKQRQPQSKIVYLHDIAKFFSVYQVSAELIGNLEAMIIRALCNDVLNVKMEKFKFKL
jgi:hypothetical protein